MNSGIMTKGTDQSYRLTIRGQVQSVGFRPLVYQLAQELKLPGRVYNAGVGAVVELHCSEQQLALFRQRLQADLPKIACIDECLVETFHSNKPIVDFHIDVTTQGHVDGQVMPDLALCPDCLRELFDPENPRYLYPLINCTYCGPRYSIIQQLPYDRPQTTMSPFKLCEPCENDYRDPRNRRFHAQPIACADCGPTVKLLNNHGQLIPGRSPFVEAADIIRDGGIVAMKGIGGYHLICDAQNYNAVKRLRERKHRPAKPLAIMALNENSLRPLVQFTEHGLEALKSPQAPLVIFHRKASALLSDDIAPGLNRLGVMLPYTPMHYLLIHAMLGEPTGYHWLNDANPCFLVMTSANASGQPIIADDKLAMSELANIADAFLVHERDILMRNDDAIVEGSGQQLVIVRRGRGMAPNKVNLVSSGKKILGFGAELKNTVCVTKDAQAYLSQYIGDLDRLDNRRYLQETTAHLQHILSIKADAVACDCHPQFFATQAAGQFAAQQQIPILQVQHHHAHAASVVAEHQLTEPVIAAVLDGFGWSETGELWGGELLYLNTVTDYQRIGHFSPLTLPGGDIAAREGWRVAAAWLYNNNEWAVAEKHFGQHQAFALLPQMLNRQLHCPKTSSAGRLFDCAAALLNISHKNSFESESAMRLQAAAELYMAAHPTERTEKPEHFYQLQTSGLLDFSLLLNALKGMTTAQGALLFHQVLAHAIAAWVEQGCDQHKCSTVVLSGGCWLNVLLLDSVTGLLQKRNLQVYTNQQTPMNDGNISLGQAYVARQKLNTLINGIAE